MDCLRGGGCYVHPTAYPPSPSVVTTFSPNTRSTSYRCVALGKARRFVTHTYIWGYVCKKKPRR